MQYRVEDVRTLICIWRVHVIRLFDKFMLGLFLIVYDIFQICTPNNENLIDFYFLS